MKVLVIATHPDDEVLGMGGTIRKHVENDDEVIICVVTVPTDPEYSMEYRMTKIKEQKQVDELLGIAKRINLGFSVLELNTIPQGRFNYKISDLIHEIQPDTVYTHFNKDLNEQHNIVSQATIVGVRLPLQCKLLMYENESTRFSLESFKPNYYVSLTEEQIIKKIDAFEFYKSEVKDVPHPRSIEGIINHAKYRGHEVGLEYAESFYLVREVIK